VEIDSTLSLLVQVAAIISAVLVLAGIYVRVSIDKKNDIIRETENGNLTYLSQFEITNRPSFDGLYRKFTFSSDGNDLEITLLNCGAKSAYMLEATLEIQRNMNDEVLKLDITKFKDVVFPPFSRTCHSIRIEESLGEDHKNNLKNATIYVGLKFISVDNINDPKIIPYYEHILINSDTSWVEMHSNDFAKQTRRVGLTSLAFLVGVLCLTSVEVLSAEIGLALSAIGIMYLLTALYYVMIMRCVNKPHVLRYTMWRGRI